MSEHQSTVDEILKRGHLKLSQADIAALEAAPDDFLPARRILGAHAFNTGDHARACEITAQVFEAAPTAENASNYISALSRANRVREAIEVAQGTDVLRPVTKASFLSEMYGRIGDFAANRDWSIRALELKEQEAPQLRDRPAPILHAFDPKKAERNVISFALWGANPRYIDGALRNAIVARHVYPGWTPRFYVDDSVPDDAVTKLRDEGAQLRKVPNLPASRYGLFWRFLVEDDPEVDLYLVRDADSVVNVREAVAVRDWLASGQPFHVMRDFVTHSELVLAGMWGAHRGNIGGMGKKILAYAKSREKVLNSRVEDQLFLRQVAWSHMRGRAFVQDSTFGFGESAPFDPGFVLPGKMHIGQDDFAARETAAKIREARARGLKVVVKD